jgi:hypothetical protein
MPPELIDHLKKKQVEFFDQEQPPFFMQHLIHGGMYARTLTMPPGTWLIGAHLRVPTIVVTVGTGWVHIGTGWAEVMGHKVVDGAAGRKQVFVADGPLVITMLFPTQAKTVEEAEAEFTDEAELLLSRRQDLNSTVITGE